MKKLGKKVTRFRKIQREKALEVNQNIGDVDLETYLATTEKLARKMHKGYFVQEKEANICKERHLTK